MAKIERGDRKEFMSSSACMALSPMNEKEIFRPMKFDYIMI